MVKAFEKVLHQKLIDAAADKNYPMTTLRLSLAAYRLARSVGNEGIYSRLIRTSQGITAGSGFATSEFRVLLICMIEAIQATWPTEQGISVMLYVDDITISATGDPEVIAEKVGRITNFANFTLEGVVGWNWQRRSLRW